MTLLNRTNFYLKPAGIVTGIINRVFANKDQSFIRYCLEAGIEPTTRQASKFRRQRGLAYKEYLNQKYYKGGLNDRQQ